MKTRESGMPSEEVWETFFSPAETLRALGLTRETQDVADFGCGYGTFTIPAAQLISGSAHAFDIEPDMIVATRNKACQHNLNNIRLHQRDFVSDGTALADASVDYAILFNILHGEEPSRLLFEAFRILRDGGTAGIMHWNYDPKTPRGPSMGIRPRPEECAGWIELAGFAVTKRHIDLPPYHYGIVAEKNNSKRR